MSLLEQVYFCHQAELKRLLRAHFRQAHLADDIMQEVWLRMQRIDDETAIRQPRDFLLRMAINLGVDMLRRDQVRQLHEGRFAVSGKVDNGELTLEQQLIDRQRLRCVWQEILALPERCKDVFMLSRLHGLSYPSIAGKLGISVSMVEKHMMKALRRCHSAEHAE